MALRVFKVLPGDKPGSSYLFASTLSRLSVLPRRCLGYLFCLDVVSAICFASTLSRRGGLRHPLYPFCMDPIGDPGHAGTGRRKRNDCFFVCLAFRRPGGDLLSHTLRCSTIGAKGFHVRVRDGIGWGTPAMTTRSSKRKVCCQPHNCGMAVRPTSWPPCVSLREPPAGVGWRVFCLEYALSSSFGGSIRFRSSVRMSTF